MKVILKEDVDNLGDMGNVVEVKNGYGRNYLIPRDLAVEANTKNIKQLEHQKKLLQSKIKKAKMEGEELSEKISAISISIEVKSGEEGKLFGSVTSKDIAEAIAAQGIEIDKRKINLQEPIKRLGEYEISVRVRQDVIATVKLEVKSSEAIAVPEAAKEVKEEEVKAEEVNASEEETKVDLSEPTEA
ncbi:MAG TPA: 50S ribosomal protein L9 [Nitrospirae bacterium]|nr:50S ribosomal protein L9 [bacterium BMS3Abin09]GBE41428.1 50S ribosomal protein L9 [bacterium BMS3Bbin09]HDH34529.1 50S ribosomal protein L9 [Nitrospirota bacterium]HDN95023.1 50S ribosomal protein L9 [Nitrospirota bacterium]HDZ84408.1 50S ribosomal protein L9 [Nitrospirota bacterium]